MRTVVIEREAPGGQAGTTSQIENYLGFPTGLSGGELARRGLAQTQKFGVEMLTPQEVVAVSLEGPYKKLEISNGDELVCHVLMIATGVSWRRPPAKGADSLIGSGVYYGAALTEAIECKGEEVYMIGAGNSAGQAAMHFSKYACKVIMLIRGDSIVQKMSHYLVEQIEATENIEVRLHTEARECHGTGRLEGLTLIDNRTEETGEVSTHGLFIFIGAEPKTEWLEGIIARDEHGFILTGHNLETPEHLKDWPLEREPYFFETNVPGIFAAGDVRHNSIKRIASAVGEGSMAVHFMHRYLASL